MEPGHKTASTPDSNFFGENLETRERYKQLLELWRSLIQRIGSCEDTKELARYIQSLASIEKLLLAIEKRLQEEILRDPQEVLKRSGLL